MAISTQVYFSGLYRLWRSFKECQQLLFLMQTQHRLNCLQAWAHRRKLAGPYECYRRRAQDIEVRFARGCVRSSSALFWARLLYAISKLVSPEPRYYAKGSAAMYRYRVT